MPAGFELKIKVEDRVSRGLRELSRVTGDLARPLRDMGEYLLRATRQRFTSQSDPDGRKWKPLSARYVARPKNQGGRGGRATPILNRLGHLRGSMRYQVEGNVLYLGTNLKFPGGRFSAAAIHQLGGKPGMAPGPAAIPARPFLGLGGADRSALLRIVERNLRRAERE